MTLPTTNLRFSNINTELGRSSTAQFSINDATFRKLALAGGTGQNQTSGTTIALGTAKGHARTTPSIGSDQYNIFASDILSASGNYAAGKTWATITVNGGVWIGSGDVGDASFTIDGTTGDIIELVNNGYISGHGGDGGSSSGSSPGTTGNVGQAGGPALNTPYPVTITNNGAIWGGGGGGGGGYYGIVGSKYARFVPGGGGGGGAGRFAGAGGNSGPGATDAPSRPGSAGSDSAGGAGSGTYGTAGGGGAGGGPGAAGGGAINGGSGAGGAGGAAGAWAWNSGNVSWAVVGDVRGSAG